MIKRDLLNVLLQGAVIEFCNTGFQRTGSKVSHLGYFQVRYPGGGVSYIGKRQGENITREWCNFDEKNNCYRLNQPARLLLARKTK